MMLLRQDSMRRSTGKLLEKQAEMQYTPVAERKKDLQTRLIYHPTHPSTEQTSITSQSKHL